MTRRRKKSRPEKTVPGKKQFLLPVLALLLTFIVRFIFILEMRSHPFSTISAQMVDVYYYHQRALDILAGNFWGSDVFFLRPLYPYLLAGVYAVFGQKALVVQLLQALLATGSCFLLYDSARRIFNRRSGLLAAFGFGLTGILVFYTGTLLYVELTVFLSLLTLWFILTAEQYWRWILAGLSYGLLVICRPELLLLLPFFILILWHKTRLRNLGIMTAAALLVIAIVPIRNLVVAHDPVLFTAHSGINFYYGNNRSADGTWQPVGELEQTPGFSHQRLKQVAKTINGKELSWSKASNYWMQKGLNFIFSNPGRFLKLLSRKFLLFWSNYEVPNNYYPETARPESVTMKLGFVNFGLIAALGLLGMVWAWPLRNRTWPVYLFTGGYLFSALAFYIISRLRAPVLPFLLMFAGFAISEFLDSIRSKKFGRLATGIGIVTAIYIGSSLIPVNRANYTAQAWTQAGNIYLSQKQPKPALKAFRCALNANPENPSARYSLLILLAGMGRTNEAEQEYNKLARLATQDPRNRILATLGAARIAIAHRDFPMATRLYHKVIEQDPTNAENHYLLGLVYISMDSLTPARYQLARAVSLDPNHTGARSALAQVKSHLRR